MDTPELDIFTSRDKISFVGQPVTREEVDVYKELLEINDKSYKLRTILGAWERQECHERSLRRCYALLLLLILFLQVVAINVAFFFMGSGWLTVERWVAQTFIVSVFGEMTGMVLIVVKYLFTKERRRVPSIVETL